MRRMHVVLDRGARLGDGVDEADPAVGVAIAAVREGEVPAVVRWEEGRRDAERERTEALQARIGGEETGTTPDQRGLAPSEQERVRRSVAVSRERPVEEPRAARVGDA